MHKPPTDENHLVVRDLNVVALNRFGTSDVLRDVSLTVRRGEVLGIVGESGSGKSTLCRAIAHLLPNGLEVRGGEIELGGNDILHLRTRKLHRMNPGGLRMIFQEPRAALDPVINIGNQLVEAVIAGSAEPMSKKEAKARSITLLDQLGIPEPTRRFSYYPHEFSGGQCQRIVTAIALAGDPSIILADEPTSALDVTTQAQLLKLLREIAAERNVGIIFVTHDYSVVSELCDRVMVMYAGAVVEQGPKDKLLFESRHPYTKALIAALPSVDKRVDALPVIKGSAPPVGEHWEGCPFSPRCAYAEPICEEGSIPLRLVNPGHESACKRVNEIWPESIESITNSSLPTSLNKTATPHAH